MVAKLFAKTSFTKTSAMNIHGIKLSSYCLNTCLLFYFYLMQLRCQAFKSNFAEKLWGTDMKLKPLTEGPLIYCNCLFDSLASVQRRRVSKMSLMSSMYCVTETLYSVTRWLCQSYNFFFSVDTGFGSNYQNKPTYCETLHGCMFVRGMLLKKRTVLRGCKRIIQKTY